MKFKKNKCWWVQKIAEYFAIHQKNAFEKTFEEALEVLFHADHEPVPISGAERDQADGRFWDFIFFEYRSPHFNNQPLVEFFVKNAHLPSSQMAYIERMYRQQVYSVFQIKETVRGKSMVLVDLIGDKEYLIKENLGTLESKAGDIISWRIIPDEKDQLAYRLSPGPAIFLPEESGLHLKKKLEYESGRSGKKTEVTALAAEKIIFSTKLATEVSKEEAETIFKSFFTSRKCEQYFYEIKDLIIEKGASNTIKRFVEILEILKISPDSDEMDAILAAYNLWANKLPQGVDGRIPEETLASGKCGPMENSINKEFFNIIVEYMNQTDLPNERVNNHVARRFQKHWLNAPQGKFGGRTPMQAIIEEREANGVTDKEFGKEYICTSFGVQEEKMTPLDQIDVSEAGILHDIHLFLNYLKNKKNQTLHLTPKGKEIKSCDAEKFIHDFKRKGILEFRIKTKKNPDWLIWDYLHFIVNLAEISNLTIEDFNSITLREKNYEAFCRKSSARQLLTLFQTWFFADTEEWSILLDDPYAGGERSLLRNFNMGRETFLANLYNSPDREKFETFFYKFYGSRKDILKESREIENSYKEQFVRLAVSHFNLFDLVELHLKRDKEIYPALPDFIQITDTGKKMLPYIIDELFFRDLDRRAIQEDISKFLSERYDRECQGLGLKKVEPNSHCPCNSGKKI